LIIECWIKRLNAVGRGSAPTIASGLDAVHDIREDVADGGAKQGQNYDNDYGDQNEDKSVLNKTLAFFFRSE
jgi:hypothetical protein